jgi:HEAT repeat protein
MNRRTMIAISVTATTGLAALIWTAWGRLAPAAPQLQLHCVPAQAHAFAIDYESHGELLDAAMGLPLGNAVKTQAVDITVRGRATETCLESDARGHVFALELSDVTGEATLEAGRKEPVGKLLAGTTYVELKPDGRVKTIHFAESMPALGRNIVRDLLSHRSMKLPAEPAHEWQTEEISLEGKYPASYQVASASSTRVDVTKRRGNDSPGRNRALDKPQVHYLDGSVAQIRLEHDWLHDLESSTEVETMSGKKAMARTRTRVVFHESAVEARRIDELRSAFAGLGDNRARRGDLAATEVEERIEDKMQREQLKNETWDTLWAKAQDPTVNEPEVFLQLRALFKLHPEECKKAAEALARLGSNKDTSFMLLTNALAATGTPEAQAALRAAIDGSTGKRDNQQVMVAELGMLIHPEQETEAYARDVVAHHIDGETRNVAQLALGSMASALAEADPQRADALVGEALQRAHDAKSLDERVTALHALGNTSSPRAFDALRAAASDPDYRVRTTAAAALRYIVGDEAEHLLLGLAVRDPEHAVRAEAVSSLSHRLLAPETFEALAQLVQRDPAEAVRQSVIRVLAGSADQFPDAESVLESVAQHDRQKDVRDSAALALMQLRSSSGHS